MLKVGVIGLGYWGPNLVRNFYHHPEVEVVAICDLNPANLQKIKSKYKDIPICATNYMEILKNDIDLVAIATPPETHYSIAKDCLLADKHILIEKPFTMSSKEGEDLIEIAEKKNLKIFVDHTFVFHPVVRKMKEIIDSGELGKIYYFDSERINLGLLQKGVNVIWDLAIHDFSIISYLFPNLSFVKVQAFGSKHIHPYHEDIAHIILKSKSDFIAHIHISWLSPIKIRKTIIGGSEKMLWWDDIHPFEKLKIYNSKIEIDVNKEDPFFPRYVKGNIKILEIENYEPLYKEVDSIVKSIKNNTKPEVDGYEGLRIVKLLESCDKSLKMGNKGIKIEKI